MTTHGTTGQSMNKNWSYDSRAQVCLSTLGLDKRPSPGLAEDKPQSEFSMQPFHLAFPVSDLEATRRFYLDLIGCEQGREAPGSWIDFNFHGHQISAHYKPDEVRLAQTNAVDGDAVPTRHFGLVLPWTAWEALAERVRAAGWEFLIAPRTRFQGEVGEQGTFFLLDPSGNALEFKTFKDMGQLFAV